MRSYEGRRGRSASREHRGGNESADAGPLGLEGGLALELAAGLDEDGVELREPLLGREEARDGPLEVAELVRVGLGAGRGLCSERVRHARLPGSHDLDRIFLLRQSFEER